MQVLAGASIGSRELGRSRDVDGDEEEGLGGGGNFNQRGGGPDGGVVAEGGGRDSEAAAEDVAGEMAKGVEFDDGHRWVEERLGCGSWELRVGRNFLVDETRKHRRRRWGGEF